MSLIIMTPSKSIKIKRIYNGKVKLLATFEIEYNIYGNNETTHNTGSMKTHISFRVMLHL